MLKARIQQTLVIVFQPFSSSSWKQVNDEFLSYSRYFVQTMQMCVFLFYLNGKVYILLGFPPSIINYGAYCFQFIDLTCFCDCVVIHHRVCQFNVVSTDGRLRVC